MPEMTTTENPVRVDQATGAPLGCSFCQSVEGPFVVVTRSLFRVQTQNGVVQPSEPIAFCAPKLENGQIIRRGCAGHIADQAGFVAPDVLALSQEATQEALDHAAQLERRIEELQASQVKVVPVDELEKIITGGGDEA